MLLQENTKTGGKLIMKKDKTTMKKFYLTIALIFSLLFTSCGTTTYISSGSESAYSNESVYFLTPEQSIEVVQIHYPELYRLYIGGSIDITGVYYKYIDIDAGRVKYYVSYVYRNHPRYYYHPYPYSRVKVYRPSKPIHHHKPVPSPKPGPGHHSPNVAPRHDNHNRPAIRPSSRPSSGPFNRPSSRPSSQHSSRSARNR